ncbi:MAG: 3-deoxy-manno-octulosonate cytidylyltransferase [Gammaproteobacteria bacterium]
MEFRVIIPVRYDSKRLPGKALLDLAGKPIMQHVYEQAVKSGAESVVIATDNDKIRKVAEDFGAMVCVTSPEHRSGTERLSEAIVALGCDDDEVIVNVQGDEPLIPPTVIRQVAQDLLYHDNIKVATLCEPIRNVEDLFNPNIVKVVMNRRGFALYFSRAPIPWNRDQFSSQQEKIKGKLQGDYFRHIGLYAYRAGFLPEYLQLEVSPLEQLESLEQLRVLWHGGRIHVAVAKEKIPPDVNTAEDLEKVRALFSKAKKG